MATKKAEGVEISIMEVQQGRLRVNVVGSSPILLNRMSEKAKRQLLLPPKPMNRADRNQKLKHVPLEEFNAAPYRLADNEAPTLLAVPGASFKRALAAAALDIPGTDEGSPLHEVAGFEWNTQKAAEQAWLDHARRLIRSVRIVITTETKTISAIAYIRDPNVPSGEQGYISVSRLRTQRESATNAMREELERAMASAQRAAEIGEALGFEFETEPILAALKAAQDRLQAWSVAA